MITTRCDRRCPDCCVHIGEHEPWDVDVGALRAVGRLLGYVQTLVVTGGEPTLHHRFGGVAVAVSGAFNFGRLLLATNGATLRTAS
ncbi:MAG: hypothetical protein ABIL09_13865, partial [Gemmatimonadota bacterium]